MVIINSIQKHDYEEQMKNKEREKISVIMPMYNEKRIKSNLREVLKAFNKTLKGYDYEIIVVDDGSRVDCTGEARRVKSKQVRVVGYKKNMGKGYALKYGFQYCTGKYVVFMDADLELPPYQIKNFIDAMKKGRVDVVIGSKRFKESQVYYPFTRRLMSLTFQIIVRILFGLNVRDTQVGMKMFRHEVLRRVFPKMLVKKYAFDVELLVLAHKAGYKIKEIPIRLDYKFGSGIRKRDVINMLLDIAAIFYRLKILKYYD